MKTSDATRTRTFALLPLAAGSPLASVTTESYKTLEPMSEAMSGPQSVKLSSSLTMLDSNPRSGHSPRSSSRLDPNLGVGDFCEQAIEDQELQDPQNSECSNVGPDHEHGPSQVLEVVRVGKVLR